MNKLQKILLALALPLSLIACSEQESTTPAATQQAASQASGGSVAPNKGLDYDSYIATIEPIFLKHGGGFVGTDTSCVACHTTQANAPLGLQPLTEENGVAFWTEEQSRQNFENVVMLVNPSAPESSRLLLAPLATTAGGDRHSGGNFWNSTDHPDYRTIANWIAAGDPNAVPTPSWNWISTSSVTACSRSSSTPSTMPCPASNATLVSSPSRHHRTATGQLINPGCRSNRCPT